jgi:hypothetical protein
MSRIFNRVVFFSVDCFYSGGISDFFLDRVTSRKATRNKKSYGFLQRCRLLVQIQFRFTELGAYPGTICGTTA